MAGPLRTLSAPPRQPYYSSLVKKPAGPNGFFNGCDCGPWPASTWLRAGPNPGATAARRMFYASRPRFEDEPASLPRLVLQPIGRQGGSGGEKALNDALNHGPGVAVRLTGHQRLHSKGGCK